MPSGRERDNQMQQKTLGHYQDQWVSLWYTVI